MVACVVSTPQALSIVGALHREDLKVHVDQIHLSGLHQPLTATGAYPTIVFLTNIRFVHRNTSRRATMRSSVSREYTE